MLLVLVLGFTACSGKHVRMVSADTTHGPRYTCKVGGSCAPATFEDESRLNPSGMVDVPLPRECAGNIQALSVLDADTSKPQADVTCAPPGARYACHAGTTCQVASGSSGDAGLAVPLPAQCGGRIHRVVILNVDTANAEIDVACAPPEETGDGGIDEM